MLAKSYATHIRKGNPKKGSLRNAQNRQPAQPENRPPLPAP